MTARLSRRLRTRRPFPEQSEATGRLLGRTARHAKLMNGKGFPMSRVNGTVKFFNHSRGFGFISPEGGDKDVFVHASALERSGVPALNEATKSPSRSRTTSAGAASKLRTCSSPRSFAIATDFEPAGQACRFFRDDGKSRRIAAEVTDQASCRIASGVIGVLRRTASSAATSNDTPMPATQASQPNRSKI